MVSDHVAPRLCGPCGGQCCKTLPGAAFPVDFGAPDRKVMRRRLKAALKSGRWAIDWWEGDAREGDAREGCDEASRSYYVRPAEAGHEGETLHPSWGGPCTFLGPEGCTAFDSRPTGCRGLKPMPDRAKGGCVVVYGSKQDACVAWLEYYEDVLRPFIITAKRPVFAHTLDPLSSALASFLGGGR